MGNINHLRLVVLGGRKDSLLTAEEWQFGINWMPTLGSPMANIHTPAGDFDTSYDVGTTSGTGYTAERNFILEGGVTDIDPMDWLANEVATAVQTWMNQANTFTSDAYITGLECYPIGTDGKVISLPVGPAKATLTTTVNTWDGNATVGALAPFTSVAHSLVTVANIPRGRGRFYPPPCGIGMLTISNGLVTSTARTSMAAGATQFLEDCALDIGPGDAYLRPCVIGDPWTTAYAVTGVKIGNIPDTQRRRKNRLTEVYTLDNCSF